MALQAGQAYVDLVPRLDPGFGARAGAMIESATKPVIARVSQAFTNFGEDLRRRGARMATFITLPLLAAAAASFKFASDLNESTSKARVVFEEMFTSVNQWAKGAARNLGISRQEALESASTFGNLFRAMKINLPTAADMSKRIVGLASDLASFNNADPKEVLESLRAGLVGEIEPLRKFGVNLTQARIEAKAMELGLWDGNDAISAGAKAQAAYALILEDTSLAQGDFARTSDGAANRQRIMTARLKDTAAMIGKRLLPIGQMLLDWVGKLLDGWDSLGRAGQRIALILVAVAIAAGPVVYVIGAIATVIGFLLSPVGLVIAALAALAYAATELGLDWGQVWEWVKRAAADAWAFIEGTILPIARDVLAAIGDGFRWLAANAPGWWEAIASAARSVFDWLDEHVFPVVARIVSVFKIGLMILGGIVLAAVEVVRFIWDNFGTYIVAAAEAVWDFISSLVETALDFVKGILDIFIGIFTLDWDTFWNGVKAVVGAIWDTIVATINFAVDTLLNVIRAGLALIGVIWNAAWSVVSSVVSTVWNAISSVVSGGINAVVGFIGSIPGRLLGFVGAVFRAGASIGKAIADGLWQGVKAVGQIVVDAGRAILNAFKSAWNFVANKVNAFLPNKIGLPWPLPDIDLPDNPIPTFHQGGIVKGRPGQEVLTLLKAGERVRTQSQEAALEQTGGSAPGTVNVVVELRGGTVIWARDLAEEIVDPIHEALLRKRRRDGDLGLADTA